MARRKDPKAIKEARNKSHMTKDEKAQKDREIYASAGNISPPDYLTDERMIAMFNKEAAYMERVNKLCVREVYGDTDVEPLAAMVISYFNFLDYQEKEQRARYVEQRKTYNAMKNKEAVIHEKYLRLLRLDPSSRIDIGETSGDDADDEDRF